MANSNRNSILRWDIKHGRWLFLPLNPLARELAKRLDPEDWVCERVESDRSIEDTGEAYCHPKKIDHHSALAKLDAVGIIDVVVQAPNETKKGWVYS